MHALIFVAFAVTVSAALSAVLSRLLERFQSQYPKGGSCSALIPAGIKVRKIDGVAAAFVPSSGVVVAPPGCDGATLRHEVGHAVDYFTGGHWLSLRSRFQTPLALLTAAGLIALALGASPAWFAAPAGITALLVGVTEFTASRWALSATPTAEWWAALRIYLVAGSLYALSILMPWTLASASVFSLTPIRNPRRKPMADMEDVMDALRAREQAQKEYDAYVKSGGLVHMQPAKINGGMVMVALLVGAAIGYCAAQWMGHEAPTIAGVQDLLRTIK